MENNKTYYVLGCRVQPIREKRYNNTGHEYELVWCHNTVVQVRHCSGSIKTCKSRGSTLQGPVTGEQVQVNYSFIPISDIPALPVATIVDVAGWVKEAGDVVEFTSRDGKVAFPVDLPFSVVFLEWVPCC